MATPQIPQNNQQRISVLQLGNQAIDYDDRNWNVYFNADPEFQDIVATYPKQISRNDLFNMAIMLNNNYNWNTLRKLFLSIMVWGYGTTGYGAYRTNTMVTDYNFQQLITSTYQQISVGNITQAYNTFNLKMCGSAFLQDIFILPCRENAIIRCH